MRLISFVALASCSAPQVLELPAEAVGPSASVGGFTVQVRPRPRGTFTADQLTTLSLHGRASEPLVFATSWVPDDAYATTTWTGTDFEVTFTGGQEINTLLSGLPIWVDLETASGTRHASIEAVPTLRANTGAGLWLSDDIRPVYVDDASNNLRYRAVLSSPTPVGSVEVSGARGYDPVVTQVNDTTWHLDWSYDGLVGAGVPGPGSAPIVARSFDGNGNLIARASARVSIEVGAVEVTDLDPLLVWIPECNDGVWDCMIDTWGDVSACGDYRPVQQCRGTDACFFDPPQALDVDEVDVQGLQDAADAWPASCSTGGQWCGLQQIVAYQTPGCLTAGTTFEDVVNEVTGSQQHQSYHVWGWGTELDAVGLSNYYLFSSNYAGGPEFLESIYQQVGSRNVMAWNSEVEIPCPNCHEWENLLVLWFPDVGRVVTMASTFGWDS